MEQTMLVLQPTFNAAADPIALIADLTPIGNDHPQIVRFGEQYLMGLETRHARIIRDGLGFLLLDLSESGATTCNGAPVGGRPITIAEGDVLQFGQHLELCVTPLSQADPQATRMLSQPTAALQLLLTPLTAGGPAAPIAVTEFPFLVSKSDGHFATYQAELPDPVSFLSRRHAHVYLNDGALQLEDLGSTNGTLHNGERLKDQAIALADGDEVRFGHKLFTFEVTVIEEESSDEATQRALPDGTVMISSAGSFLDVYCGDAGTDDNDGSVDTDTGVPAALPGNSVALAGAEAAWRAARLRWQQWPYLRARQLLLFLVLPALVLAFTLVTATRDSRPEQAQALLDQGQPRAALAIAAGYAAEHPQETVATQLLESAFEQAVLPGWIERMQSGQPGAAHEHLDEHLQLAPTLAADRTASLLIWMSDLALFMAQAEGGVAMSVANDNAQVQDLATQWRDNADHYTRLLRRYTDSYAELSAVHSRAMSSIRAIQGDGADQLKAVAELHARTAEMIDQSQFDAARTVIAQFGAEHPNLQGMDAFSTDFEKLAAIGGARLEQNLAAFVTATEDLDFDSAFFASAGSGLAQERRQALAARQQRTNATALWHQGQLEAAIASLTTSDEQAWSGVIAAQRLRYTGLQQDFNDLLLQVGTPQYPDSVIDFYARLDVTEDAFMRRALADDFASQRDRALTNAQQLAAEGADLWLSYNQSFQGIGGGLRLEAEVSDTYREFAAQLSASVTVLGRAHRLYTLLEVDVPTALVQQHQEAGQEVVRQRNALDSLRSVLGRQVTQEKLSLLPVVGQGA